MTTLRTIAPLLALCLVKIEKDLAALVDLALSRTLTKATIREKGKTLLKSKAELVEALETDIRTLNSMPDIKQVKREAEEIRRQLLKHFSSKEHLLKMSFDEKRSLLHWLFQWSDQGGKRGIYIFKDGLGKGARINFRLHTGLVNEGHSDITWAGHRRRWSVLQKNEYKSNFSTGV